ncbi:acetoacetate decarboxylase [Colletotrichum sp. SAR11_59]|nr:acetoacetate decarboxylase [Colletotrichum sp. SAR11_59]
MSYVATPEEVRAWEELSSKPSFSQELITVDFTTTPEFIKSVIPPGFEPGDEPRGHISLGTMESRLCGEFDCVMVSIDVKFRGRPGAHMLELIIMGEFGNDLPARKREATAYEIKAYPHSMGKGLQWEPRVNILTVIEEDTRRSVGKGRLAVRGTSSDPLHSIPILSIGEMEYVSGKADYTVVEEQELGCGQAYLPYLVGRHYDDLRDFRVGAEWNKLEFEKRKVQGGIVREYTTPSM